MNKYIVASILFPLIDLPYLRFFSQNTSTKSLQKLLKKNLNIILSKQ